MRIMPVAIVLVLLFSHAMSAQNRITGRPAAKITLEEYALRINDAQVSLRRDPTALAPHLTLGEAYYHTGNQAASRYHLETFLKSAVPGADSIRAAHLQARVLLNLGLRLRATRALTRLAARPGVPAEVWHDFALLMRKDRFPVEAVMAEMRALELSRGDPVYRRESARQWKEVSRPVQAIEQYMRLPDSIVTAEDHFQTGFLAHRIGSFPLAERGYELALLEDPSHPEAHYNLSLLSEHSGHVDQAIYHLEQLLRVRPRYEVAYFALGRLFLSQERSAEAEAIFQRFLVFGEDSLALAEADGLIRTLRKDRESR